jgi:hypothetical protein
MDAAAPAQLRQPGDLRVPRQLITIMDPLYTTTIAAPASILLPGRLKRTATLSPPAWPALVRVEETIQEGNSFFYPPAPYVQ